MSEEPSQPSREKIVLDTSDGPPPPEVAAMLAETAASLGMDFELGEVKSCATCGFFDCVCEIRKVHKPDCKFRRAMETSVGISCDHGHDVCPECDPCTCGAEPSP